MSQLSHGIEFGRFSVRQYQNKDRQRRLADNIIPQTIVISAS